MPVSPLCPGDPTMIGGFTIAARLEAGGMGTVYLGADPAGRPVAVKVIQARIAREPDFRRRFRREISAAGTVSGTCLARVLAADPDAPTPWFASEYVAGATLAEVVEAEGPLPPAILDALAVGLAEALTAIHLAGVVHRDLKPANVIIATTGPKVIDFGMSRLPESTTVTRPGSVLGSPGFMAPEQVSADQVGPAADVYSWALTVAFAATGRPPFGTGRPEVLMYRVIGEEPDLAGVPDHLLPILHAALHRDPTLRPTAETLVRWLILDPGDPAEVTARLLGQHWHPDLGGPSTPPGSGAAAAAGWPGLRSRPVLLAAGTLALVVGVLTVTLLGVHLAGGGSGRDAGITGGRSAATIADGVPAATPTLPAPTGPATAPSDSAVSTAPPFPLVGQWRGSYTCSQGVTGLLLTIVAAPTGDLGGTFEFYPLPENPGVPRGSYSVRVSYTDGSVNVTADHWINQPVGYDTVNLSARPVADQPDTLSGRVHLEGCGGFHLTRV